MSETSTGFLWRDIPKALYKSPAVRALTALAVIIEIYTIAVAPSFLQTQDARVVTAKAKNAALHYRADADNAEAKAVTETQIANNAARKQVGEARKAVALADKTKYEAEVAKAASDYAALRAKADADAQDAQADLIKQKEQIQNEVNAYVERRRNAEAEIAESKAFWQKFTSRMLGNNSVSLLDETFYRQCQAKFDNAINHLHAATTREEVEAVGRHLALHKAKCGFTKRQAQQLSNVAAYYKRKPNEGETGGRSAARAGAAFRVKSKLSNLRNGPGIRHDIIAELPKGTLLRQTGDCVHSDDGVTRDPWCKVDWNGTPGWASSSGLEAIQDAASSNSR
jgi:hypothetical protein